MMQGNLLSMMTAPAGGQRSMLDARIVDLQGLVSKLPERDQAFALSLVSQHLSKGYLSDRQWPHVSALIARATGQEAAARPAVGDLSGVLALFAKAAPRLKRPTIVLHVGSEEIRINVAGAKARVPGSLNVVADGRETWFGRIHTDGSFEPSRRDVPPPSLLPALRAFAADPAGVAAAHGKLTGRCCFCNLPLGRGKDKRSAAVGYGPDCAENYGLAWGVK